MSTNTNNLEKELVLIPEAPEAPEAPRESEIQRIVSVVNLGYSYVDRVFRLASRHLKELKTTEELIKITENICMEISKMEMTTEAYDFVKEEIYKSGGSKIF